MVASTSKLRFPCTLSFLGDGVPGHVRTLPRTIHGARRGDRGTEAWLHSNRVPSSNRLGETDPGDGGGFKGPRWNALHRRWLTLPRRKFGGVAHAMLSLPIVQTSVGETRPAWARAGRASDRVRRPLRAG
jgi:hypothetical protein